MYSSQPQQEEASFYDERAEITSELHAIVDNLQPDPPPQVAPTPRPFWKRTGVWQVPLCLVALTIILMYNPRVDNCNGFKITYKQQVLCISNDADFFLFVENFTCDFIETDKSVMDSLVADEAATDKMKAYFDKHNFSIETQPIEAEVLRGMRGQYDSASFCKNFTKACWNKGVRLLNAGQKDSACYYFNKTEAWSWGDSVLTAADKSVISQNCYGDLLPYQSAQPMTFQETNQEKAKGLNAANNRLKNANNVVQNRINKLKNKSEPFDANAKPTVNALNRQNAPSIPFRLNPTPSEKQSSNKDSADVRNQPKPKTEYATDASVTRNYIEKFKNLAMSEQLANGIPASIILAQAILESLAGESALAIDANNHFGLKCQTCSEKESFLALDDEYDKNGKLIYSKFYRFKTPEESFALHTQLLTTRPRYRSLFELGKTDYRAWALGLQKIGYATSPNYAEKLISLIEKYELYKFDKQDEKIKKN